MRRLGILGVAMISGLGMAQAETSQLWGKSGELWTPAGRLPDFSHAGYHAGVDPIPNVPVVANVMDFGARGDGHQDDTAAFLAAIKSAFLGAVMIPPGRYKITGQLKMDKSNIVLRGAGQDK